MCGIVGLLVKDPKQRDRLGEWMVPMLVGMTERGPDSAGMAVFGKPVAAKYRKLNLYAANAGFDWAAFETALHKALKGEAALAVKANHAIVQTAIDPATLRKWLAASYPELHVLS